MSDVEPVGIPRSWKRHLEVLAGARWLALSGVLLLSWGIADSIRLSNDPALVRWSLTHWLFTYDYGFVKRGLPGEVLSWFVEPRFAYSVAIRWAFINSVLVGLALAATIWRPFVKFPERGLFIFALVATTHFATVQHFFYDIGRFDHFGVLISLLCLWLGGRRQNTGVALVLAGLCGLGVVIHEAFALAFMPTVVAYWLYKTQGRLSPLWRWLVLAVPILVVCLVMWYARPSIGQQLYLSLLQARYGDWIHGGSVSVLYVDTGVNLRRSLEMLVSGRRLLHHLILAACLAPSLVLLAHGLRACVGRPATLRPPAATCHLGLLISAMSPLCLYAIGVDFARWWSLAITNVFVVLALLLHESDAFRAVFTRACLDGRGLLVSVLIVNLIVGPLGVAASAFPRLDPILRTVERAVRR